MDIRLARLIEGEMDWHIGRLIVIVENSTVFFNANSCLSISFF